MCYSSLDKPLSSLTAAEILMRLQGKPVTVTTYKAKHNPKDLSKARSILDNLVSIKEAAKDSYE